jgi:thioredoxin 1
MKKVLRFTASWCGPCKMLARNLEDVNTIIPIEVIDIDEKQDIAVEYGVRGVPTLVMLDENVEVKRLVGMTSLKQLEDWFND